MTVSNVWQIGKGVKNIISPVTRAIIKNTILTIPKIIIDELFDF